MISGHTRLKPGCRTGKAACFLQAQTGADMAEPGTTKCGVHMH